MVGRDYHRRIPSSSEPTTLDPDHARAKLSKESRVVRDNDDSYALGPKFSDAFSALCLESLVSDGKELINEQDLRSPCCRKRESEPRDHARRVRA
jgi:hypothetical protein